MIVLGLWWWLRQPSAKQTQLDRPARPPDGRRDAPPSQPAVIVPCAWCGTHVPGSEAIHHPNGPERFCGEGHRIEWLRSKTPAASRGSRSAP